MRYKAKESFEVPHLGAWQTGEELELPGAVGPELEARGLVEPLEKPTEKPKKDEKEEKKEDKKEVKQ